MGGGGGGLTGYNLSHNMHEISITALFLYISAFW